MEIDSIDRFRRTRASFVRVRSLPVRVQLCTMESIIHNGTSLEQQLAEKTSKCEEYKAKWEDEYQVSEALPGPRPAE